ncbi:hypothetical protein C6570_01855 [Ottowia oryzae]|uniref:Uncharacterized protein n=1 Tax=Ottowia oryzae TaxID=2109914 RepID=A0A2S0MBE1_9BURK|nr:hypothetical protein C6570_01855 [Ottowia oryzae]
MADAARCATYARGRSALALTLPAWATLGCSTHSGPGLPWTANASLPYARPGPPWPCCSLWAAMPTP